MDLFIIFFDPSNYFFYDIGLKDFFKWVQEQAKYILYMFIIFLLIVCVVKRAWIYAIGVLLGLAAAGIFIEKPESLLTITSWLGKLLGITK